MGQQILSQLFHDPGTLAVTALVIGVMGIISGMSNIAFLSLTLALGGFSYWRYQDTQVMVEEPAIEEQQLESVSEERESSWEDVALIDQIGLEVGYRLIPMVGKKQGGQLLSKIKGVRKKLIQELGFFTADNSYNRQS